jgi:hypothetical protein
MTHTTKWIVGVLVVIGLLGLLCIAVVGGFIYYVYRGEGSGEYETNQAAGREFGKTADQAACVKEGLARAKGIRLINLNRNINNQAFVAECLKSARPNSGFCDGVPAMWKLQDSEWTNQQCENAGMDSVQTGCGAVFQAKLDFCYGRQ